MIFDRDGRTETEATADMFEYEYCAECGLDAEDHTAIPFLGNFFFRCDTLQEDQT